MEYGKAFLCGGALCVLGQLLIDRTALTPAKILVLYVTAGVVLSALGLYQPLADWAGAGATVPLTGFGHLLARGPRGGGPGRSAGRLHRRGGRRRGGHHRRPVLWLSHRAGGEVQAQISGPPPLGGGPSYSSLTGPASSRIWSIFSAMLSMMPEETY